MPKICKSFNVVELKLYYLEKCIIKKYFHIFELSKLECRFK